MCLCVDTSSELSLAEQPPSAARGVNNVCSAELEVEGSWGGGVSNIWKRPVVKMYCKVNMSPGVNCIDLCELQGVVQRWRVQV